MVVNFYLKDGNATKETWIYCLLRYQNKRVKQYTSQLIHPKFWNFKEHEVRKSHPNSPELNHWLKGIKTYVAKLELEWIKKHSSEGIVPIPPPSYYKENLKKLFTKTTKEERESHNQKTFWGFYDKFLTRMKSGTRVHLSKGTPMAPKTIFQFENLKRHLENFQRSKKMTIEFEKIDITFYNDFVEYLTTKLELGPNTIAKLITNLKVYLRESFDEGVSNNNIYSNRRFRAVGIESQAIYLKPKEIKEIIDLDLSESKRLEKIRDMFIICCYTGLRYSDIVKIKPEHIEGGMILKMQEKTKDRVAIPIRKEVKELLIKHDYSLYKISNQKYNQYLHEVVKKCDGLQQIVEISKVKGGKQLLIKKYKWELVTSHTARRSFATNEFMKKDLTLRDIMSITGHKTEKSFYKYIRQSPHESAERVKVIWEESDENEKNLTTSLN